MVKKKAKCLTKVQNLLQETKLVNMFELSHVPSEEFGIDILILA